MCLDRRTKDALKNPKPSSQGSILEMVLHDQSITHWMELIEILRRWDWDDEGILAFFRWIDTYVPVLNANGKVDPTALCWALLEAQRPGIAKIARVPDVRRIEARDRLIRNYRWLAQLYNPKRIPNAAIRAAIEANVVLDADKNLLEEILRCKGVVTGAGNVKPTLLRKAFESYGFGINARYELTLLGMGKEILRPEPSPMPQDLLPRPTVHTPAPPRPEPERPASTEIPTVSRRMAVAHRSLIVILNLLVRHYGWRNDNQNLIPAALIWKVVEFIWKKRTAQDQKEQAFDWLEDAGIVRWALTANIEGLGGQYALYYVPPRPLVTIRSGDTTPCAEPTPFEAKEMIETAFRELQRDPRGEPKIIRMAIDTASHRSTRVPGI